MYNEILEDCGGDVELAKSRSQEKHVYYYWKILAEERSVTIHPEMYPLNMNKYKEELFNCIEPILEAYGVKEEDLNKLHDELVDVDRKVQQSNLSEF